MQSALQASQQAAARLEQSLQQQTAEMTRMSSTSSQAAAASTAELHRLTQQAEAMQQHLCIANSRIEEERAQSKQLAAALTAAQHDYQVQQCISAYLIAHLWLFC